MGSYLMLDNYSIEVYTGISHSAPSPVIVEKRAFLENSPSHTETCFFYRPETLNPQSSYFSPVFSSERNTSHPNFCLFWRPGTL